MLFRSPVPVVRVIFRLNLLTNDDLATVIVEEAGAAIMKRTVNTRSIKRPVFVNTAEALEMEVAIRAQVLDGSLRCC